MNTCPITSFPLPDGYVIHPECAEILNGRLRDLPVYMQALHAGLTKQTRRGGNGIRMSPELTCPINLSFLEHEAVIITTLRSWTHDLSDRLQVAIPTVWEDYASFYQQHGEWLCRQSDAEQAFDELMHALDYLEMVVEHRPHRRFAGRCAVCSTPAYVTGEQTTAVCPNCRHQFSVSEERERMMRMLETAWLRPTDALAVVSCYMEPPKRENLRKLAQRGHIQRRGHGADMRYQPAQIIAHYQNR